MWRRGERLYALVVFGVVALEALALGVLVLSFTGRLLGLVGSGAVFQSLLQGLALTALALLVLSAYVLLYHAYTAWREVGEHKASTAWLDRFTEALFAGEPPPPPPWPAPALQALLSLREMLKGEFADTLTEWLRQGLPRWARVLKSRFASKAARLEALDALAQARLPEALPLVLPYLEHRDPVLRLAAARAGARLAQGEGVALLAEALQKAGLPRGALLEVLLLLEDRALPVVERFLVAGEEKERWAALEAIGRLRLHAFVPQVLDFLESPDPELKAAALRALYRLGYPPEGHEEAVLSALLAPEEFLRLHAVRLLPLLGGALARKGLWRALSDPSFYVRKAAAEGLRALDPELLEQAAAAHPDAYGRALAAQVLRGA